jgi:hypothetical protein
MVRTTGSAQREYSISKSKLGVIMGCSASSLAEIEGRTTQLIETFSLSRCISGMGRWTVL